MVEGYAPPWTEVLNGAITRGILPSNGLSLWQIETARTADFGRFQSLLGSLTRDVDEAVTPFQRLMGSIETPYTPLWERMDALAETCR